MVSLELGESIADKIFCGNEWMEALFDPNGISDRDFKDRRKDLYHNRVGRKIATKVKKSGLKGRQADNEIKMLISESMEHNQRDLSPDRAILNHYRDPRYYKLVKTETELNCDHLPSKSILQLFSLVKK